MKQLGGLFIATILLAGALVAPINFASADIDDYDHDEIEEIEDFDDGVVLFYSSTTGKDIREKIKQLKMELIQDLKELRTDFRGDLFKLIDQYREDHDRQAFKVGFNLLKNETKIKFNELRHDYRDALKDIQNFIKMELPKDDRKTTSSTN